MNEFGERASPREIGITDETGLKTASLWIPTMITTQNGRLTCPWAANGKADSPQFGVHSLREHLFLFQRL